MKKSNFLTKLKSHKNTITPKTEAITPKTEAFINNYILQLIK